MIVNGIIIITTLIDIFVIPTKYWFIYPIVVGLILIRINNEGIIRQIVKFIIFLSLLMVLSIYLGLTIPLNKISDWIFILWLTVLTITAVRMGKKHMNKKNETT